MPGGFSGTARAEKGVPEAADAFLHRSDRPGPAVGPREARACRGLPGRTSQLWGEGYSTAMEAVIIGNPNSGSAGDEGYLECFAPRPYAPVAWRSRS
jgi:hypothetical protein